MRDRPSAPQRASHLRSPARPPLTGSPSCPTPLCAQLFGVGMMLLGGIAWGFIIATLLNLANPSQDSMEFRQGVEDLNAFMSTHGLPDEMRVRLREYVHETRPLAMHRSQIELLSALSPKLMEDVSMRALVHRSPIEDVPFMRKAEKGFLAQVALSLIPKVFPPNELVPLGSLHILARGKASYNGKPIVKGASWGDDCLLDNPKLRLGVRARALTIVTITSISAEQMLEIATSNGFVGAYKAMRRHVLLLAVRRSLYRRFAERRFSIVVAKRLEENGGSALRSGSRLDRMREGTRLPQRDRDKGSGNGPSPAVPQKKAAATGGLKKAGQTTRVAAKLADNKPTIKRQVTRKLAPASAPQAALEIDVDVDEAAEAEVEAGVDAEAATTEQPSGFVSFISAFGSSRVGERPQLGESQHLPRSPNSTPSGARAGADSALGSSEATELLQQIYGAIRSQQGQIDRLEKQMMGWQSAVGSTFRVGAPASAPGGDYAA